MTTDNNKCPDLVEWPDKVIFLCKAGDKPYTTDCFELTRHCKNRDYRNCPYHVRPASGMKYPGMN